MFINFTNTLTKLHIVLSALEDSNPAVRIAVHRLFKATKLVNTTSLHATIQAILSSAIHRYPKDIESAYSTMKYLGKNHPSLTGKSVYLSNLLKLYLL
jgi:hypothetical protein